MTASYYKDLEQSDHRVVVTQFPDGFTLYSWNQAPRSVFRVFGGVLSPLYRTEANLRLAQKWTALVKYVVWPYLCWAKDEARCLRFLATLRCLTRDFGGIENFKVSVRDGKVSLSIFAETRSQYKERLRQALASVVDDSPRLVVALQELSDLEALKEVKPPGFEVVGASPNPLLVRGVDGVASLPPDNLSRALGKCQAYAVGGGRTLYNVHVPYGLANGPAAKRFRCLGGASPPRSSDDFYREVYGLMRGASGEVVVAGDFNSLRAPPPSAGVRSFSVRTPEEDYKTVVVNPTFDAVLLLE